MVTYGSLFNMARQELFDSYATESANVARTLLCSASGKNAADIIAGRALFASESEVKAIRDFVARAKEGEPIPYIIEQWDFYGMTLTVNRHVLIPRDDTIVVTEMAAKKALFLSQNPRILDLCTGSGCIGLALAHRVKDARVTLGDISPEAMRVAKKNIVDQKLSGRVNCMAVDVHQKASKFLGIFDMIVSNPPYITQQEMLELDESVRGYEPHLALDGGADGLDFYRDIVKNFLTALKPEGYICFEFGMGQEEAVCQILIEAGFKILQLQKDTGHIIRAVMAQHIKEGG